MITGYAGYEPTPEDAVAQDFDRSRLAMIERAAKEYTSLKPELQWDVDKWYLNVHAVADGCGTDRIEEDVANFATSLEDSNLGYLAWEYDTAEERDFLESLNVAVMNCHHRADDEPLRATGAP